MSDEDWGKRLVLKSKRCTLERAEKFISETYFNDINLRSRLYPKTFGVSELLHHAAEGRVKYANAINGTFSPVKIGDKFGPSWSTHWFKVTVQVPESWEEEEVRFRWNSNSEAMVWKDGKPVQGLSGSERTDYILTNKSVPGTRFCLYVEMACNGMFGTGGSTMISPPLSSRYFELSMAEIAVFDRDCYQLIVDLTVVIGMAKHLPEDNLRGAQALFVANDIVNMCEVFNRKTYKQCHEHAERFLKQKNGEGQHEIHAMGHCHIDSAWLWPYAETVRKCGRSWASAVQLMKTYPKFTFTCSQAQQFEWVKIHYPALYDDIKTFVKTGNFIPVGGTWVEMDGNIPSGESFVRQFLFGQTFFKSEFGLLCQEFWLPDTFGYSAQLPQIMVGSGIKYFVTQKLSWSLINKFPHNSFIWEGIDGSRCLAHFPPGDTYESMAGVDDIVKTVRNHKDKGRTNVSILLYGYGDGGGGPNEEMIEKLARVEDTNGLPRIKSSTPQKFFKSLDERDSSNLCTWIGELYLELHQGTFTVEAKIKDGNRRCEFLLHDVEFISSVALVMNKTSSKVSGSYPREELGRLWKLLLLNQFHDVLPGSCISEVVDDALKYYSDIKQSGLKLLCQGYDTLVEQLQSSYPESTSSSRLVAFNTHCWERREVVKLPDDLHNNINQFVADVETQTLCSGGTLVFVNVPSMGLAVLQDRVSCMYEPCTIQALQDSHVLFKNKFLTAKVDCIGRVLSLLHNTSGRNAIAPGYRGNQFVIFDNVPLYWDAWDVMPYHLETRKELAENHKECQVEIVEKGPLRVSAKFSLKISELSRLTQEISLDAGSPYLTFHTQVEWHENRKFLKVEFPVSVRSSSATYEIQFGHLQRPTHFNTSWDWARYEVCGQKWIDLSEHNWGCSIINNNKYGFSTHGNVMSVSLLRSPKAPDGDADMGSHDLKYAVFPHSGTFQDSGLIQHSYNFNNEVNVIQANFNHEPKCISFFQVTNSAIILETVKKAEDHTDALVLRAYESFGGHNSAKITSTFNFKNVVRCNLLEKIQGEELKWCDGGVKLDFKPFEIITLMLFLSLE